jgi:hypothetical protein
MRLHDLGHIVEQIGNADLLLRGSSATHEQQHVADEAQVPEPRDSLSASEPDPIR